MADVPTQRDEEGGWAKLRRRKVVQWGIAYAAGAWGLQQGFAYVSALLDWPADWQKVTGLALLTGLLIVLTLAWYHGDKGEQRVTRVEITIIAMLLIAGGAIVWRYDWLSAPTSSPARTVAAPVPATSARPSVAVLPFENRSAEAGDAFFVDGIHDDILTQLSKIGALKVISRTSVERFRRTDLSIREIAQQLGVSTILEGGVQRAGDRVRITVQLIDAASDAHLWAENYDRELTAANIFAIQSEVASAIALALRATLTPQEKARVAVLPTRNLAAWEAYQNGRQRLMRRTTAAIGEAGDFFRAAIARDPDFALAYAGLADATWLEADFQGRNLQPAIAKAEEYLGVALRLDPNLPEARATLAKFAQDRREFEKAESLYREAIELDPNYSQAHYWYAQLLSIQGRSDEAMASLQRAVELDPLSPLFQATLAWGLTESGKFDEALAGFEKLRGIDPDSPLAYDGIGAILARAYGRLDQAIPYLERSRQLDSGRIDAAVNLGQTYLDLGDFGEAERVLRDADKNGHAPAIAYLRLYRGEPSRALEIAIKRLDVEPRDQEALRLLRDADLRRHDAASARARYAQAYPELLDPVSPDVNGLNLGAAIDLALVLQSTGEHARASDLLDRCDGFIDKSRWVRMGPWGYGIADVQILAMRGRARAALDALRSAANAGWRGTYWRYFRDFDPALGLIRPEPEFKSIFEDIERDMTRQRSALAARPAQATLDRAATN